MSREEETSVAFDRSFKYSLSLFRGLSVCAQTETPNSNGEGECKRITPIVLHRAPPAAYRRGSVQPPHARSVCESRKSA